MRMQGNNGALEVEEPAHLNGAAEGDLAIALAKVHVPHGQLGTLHKHCTCSTLLERACQCVDFMTLPCLHHWR